MQRFRRRVRYALGACLALFLAVSAYVWRATDLPYELGLSDARFESLPIGSSGDRVLQVMGTPGHRHTRAAEGPQVAQHISPCASGGYEPGVLNWDIWRADMQKRTSEVWKWNKGLRIICMVFDRDGKLIFKYVDA